MSCTSHELASAAKCFLCMTSRQLRNALLYALCQWADAEEVVYPCGIPSTRIQLTGGGDPDSNQIYEQTSPTIWTCVEKTKYTIDTSADPIVLGSTDDGITTVLAHTDATNFPCNWTADPDSGEIPPAPTGHYV